MHHLEQSSKRRKGIIALVVAGALTSTMALAANPHCTGNDAEAILNPDGTVTFVTHVAGFGSETIEVDISVPVSVDIDCQNPGGNIAPGQSFTTTATGSAVVDPSESGQAQINVTTDPIEIPDEDEACPNGRWTVIPSLSFGTLVADFSQAGDVVLSAECTFNAVTQQFTCQCG